MIKYFVRVDQIYCETYNSIVEDNILFLPTNKNETIEYTVALEFRDYTNVIVASAAFTNIVCCFTNSKTGTKYYVNCIFDSIVNNLHYFTFTLNKQSYEDSNSDLLEISFKSVTHESYLRLPIKVKYVRSSKRVFTYQTLVNKILDSNLLTNKTKVGFASWSTVEKNINSVALKLLEPLHAVYTETYSKVNEYLKQSFNLDYTPLKYSRVLLKNYPKLLTRVNEDSIVEELKESHDAFSAPKKLRKIASSESLNLFSIVFDDKRATNYLYNSINQQLDVKADSLYVRILDSSTALYTSCIITGLNKNNVLITESVIIRKDMYTKVQNLFIKIETIECNIPIELTNFVDLRYSHYVDSSPYIIPPVVDRNLSTFKPEVVIKTNHELTNNIVTLNNRLIERGLEQYKFNIEDTDLISLYINDSLDVIYTTETSLNYSKLSHDYSQKIGDKTCNNNPYIEVSDSNTNIGDWCDVIVNIDKVVEDLGVKAFYLEVKNENNTFYYDIALNTLTVDKTFIYTELAPTSVLSFSAFVENASSYVFSIVDEQTNMRFSAMIENYVIKPYQTKEFTSDLYLILVNDKVIAVSNTGEIDTSNMFSPLGLSTNQMQNELVLCLNHEYASRLDFILYINEYILSSVESTLPENAYSMYYNRTKGLTYIYFDKRVLNTLFGTTVQLKLGTSYNKNYGVLLNDSKLSSKFEIKDFTSQIHSTLLLPKKLIGQPTQIEYVIDLNLNDIENLTITRESDYD